MSPLRSAGIAGGRSLRASGDEKMTEEPIGAANGGVDGKLIAGASLITRPPAWGTCESGAETCDAELFASEFFELFKTLAASLIRE
jgi:hypothetical protein